MEKNARKVEKQKHSERKRKHYKSAATVEEANDDDE